jgi:hypothetical protein
LTGGLPESGGRLISNVVRAFAEPLPLPLALPAGFASRDEL